MYIDVREKKRQKVIRIKNVISIGEDNKAL
jgi:hypothetical protein